MSDFLKRAIASIANRSEPLPRSFAFGDGIDWLSPLEETFLYVELPFWLMTPPGPVKVKLSGNEFAVEVCSPWIEVFVGEVTDSRVSCLHWGPQRPEGYRPTAEIANLLSARSIQWLPRSCKTVLRLTTHAHASAFRKLAETEPPRARQEQETYWSSLCEAYLPVVNEVIQRYRLVTYDYFAYELSAWDVPIWYLKHADVGYRAVLVPYKSWDVKPVTIEDGEAPGGHPKIEPFGWATPAELSAASSNDATPGEFDLLDARSLMERGDYTGAVRRTVTAIEAVLAMALRQELEKRYEIGEAARRLANTDNDFPGRLAQWRKLAQPQIGQQEFDEFESTRRIRHDIVHRGRRLVHDDRGLVQRAVDSGRWLYNKIEADPGRATLRDKGILKSVGRVALAPRFPATITENGIVLGPMISDRSGT